MACNHGTCISLLELIGGSNPYGVRVYWMRKKTSIMLTSNNLVAVFCLMQPATTEHECLSSNQLVIISTCTEFRFRMCWMAIRVERAVWCDDNTHTHKHTPMRALVGWNPSHICAGLYHLAVSTTPTCSNSDQENPLVCQRRLTTVSLSYILSTANNRPIQPRFTQKKAGGEATGAKQAPRQRAPEGSTFRLFLFFFHRYF